MYGLDWFHLSYTDSHVAFWWIMHRREWRDPVWGLAWDRYNQLDFLYIWFDAGYDRKRVGIGMPERYLGNRERLYRRWRRIKDGFLDNSRVGWCNTKSCTGKVHVDDKLRHDDACLSLRGGVFHNRRSGSWSLGRLEYVRSTKYIPRRGPIYGGTLIDITSIRALHLRRHISHCVVVDRAFHDILEIARVRSTRTSLPYLSHRHFWKHSYLSYWMPSWSAW